jgi:GntR family histidine utilization transcriptional repressor
VTLDQRIRGDIETRIRSGEWRPGDRIPFEHELVATYQCARGTVSKALEGLARAGLIERRRKAGSFVAHPPVHSAVLGVPDLPLLIAARGETYRWELLRRELITSGEQVTGDDFALPALRVEGTHLSNDVPFCFEARLISLSTLPEASEADFTGTPPGTWLSGHIPWTQARHRIKAIGASSIVARRLRVKTGTPCLEVQRRTWRLDEPVTAVTQIFPGDRYDLNAQFEPSS